eukprot:TRINITY_DN46938_c0_g1_i1.p1 TRINITY_DN46938_c0_g1~~TRINITY_DN46938_c0_g1_i1.p1  ORF type:complete len:670 (+),score=237.27 TRINITY_DN46938_c0_g1_i1:298-2010(+)
MAQTDLMHDVVSRMEDLLAQDATQRASRLGELENKQRQLFELHNLIQQNEQEGIQQVTNLCKESITHLIHECKLYHEELDRLRRENRSLQDMKTEFHLLKMEGNGMLTALTEAKERIRYLESQVEPNREKAETLATHLVEAVKEKHSLEESIERLNTDLGCIQDENSRLSRELKQTEDRLTAFEEAAQADINELLERDAQNKQVLEQMKKSTTTLDEYKNQHDLQMTQIKNYETRCTTLSTELSSKCKELDACRAQGMEAEQRHRTNIAELETSYQRHMQEADQSHRAQIAELEAAYKAHMQEAERRLAAMQQHDTRRMGDAESELSNMKDTIERLTVELTKKCQECATVSVKLSTANEELEDKASLLNSIKEEIMLMRDASEHSKHETGQAIDSLNADIRAKENTIRDLADEVQRLRQSERDLQDALEETKHAAHTQAKKVQLDSRRVAELETQLEAERRVKEDLSLTVAELQKQTLNLAQEKGRLISELSVRRSQPQGAYASHTPLSGVSIDGPSEEIRQISMRHEREGGPLVLPPPQHSSRITELEEKLSKMKTELQGMVKGHNPLQ